MVDSAPATNSAPIGQFTNRAELALLIGFGRCPELLFSRVGSLAIRNGDEVHPLCVTRTLCQHVEPIGMALKSWARVLAIIELQLRLEL